MLVINYRESGLVLWHLMAIVQKNENVFWALHLHFAPSTLLSKSGQSKV